MKDPRDLIESHGLVCERNKAADEFWARDAVHSDAPVLADWSTMIAFATAILAADAEWRGQNAPTVEELRARYPRWRFDNPERYEHWSARAYLKSSEPTDTRFKAGGIGTTPAEAIANLAAELAKTEGS